MKLITDRLDIRPFKKSDYKRMNELCSNYEVAKTTLGIPVPYSEQIAKDFIEHTKQSIKANKTYELGICLKENENCIVGCVSIMGISERVKRAEIAYWVDRKLWGKGIATEAAKAIINFGFEKLKLHTIFARCFDTNPASSKVMQKCGMKYAGKLRENEFRFEKYYDVLYYDLLATEWIKNN